MKATSSNGKLNNLENCYIGIGPDKIVMRQLPDISDSKSAAYNDEIIMGRSFPIKSFSHGENRAISFTIHFTALTKEELLKNLSDLRKIESCVYPRETDQDTPFHPPVVCTLKCGDLLGQDELCVVLKSYTVKFPTDVVWDDTTYVPMKFDVDTSWDVTYSSSELPGADRIFQSGN